MPKHALVGYWHNFDNGSGLLRVANVDNTWDVIVIAFADDAGNGSVKFVLDPALNKAQFIADVASKRAGQKSGAVIRWPKQHCNVRDGGPFSVPVRASLNALP